MKHYFQSYTQFEKDNKALKNGTITAEQLMPAIVRHIVRMDRTFSLQVNGRLPKPMHELLEDVFELSHLQQPFYTQHCASRSYRYMNVSKNRIKIDFTMKYRMSRDEEKWMIAEMNRILARIVEPTMTDLMKVCAVHDYIVRHYTYELQTNGSPFAVYTFMHEKKGVCMAYALLFEKMMELLGIPCYYVIGHADGEGDVGHAWNMVQLDGLWYHVDVTWDDLGSRTKQHAIRYRYFLRDDAFMKRDHTWAFAHYPICHDTRFATFSKLYDAACHQTGLYAPHPKTATLTHIAYDTQAMTTLLEAQVQYCTLFNEAVYFSHYGQGAALYCYDIAAKTFALIDSRQVVSIHGTLESLRVTFTEGEPLQLETTQPVQLAEQVTYKEAQLTRIGTSWFGQFEQRHQAGPIRFTDGQGLTLCIEEPIAQLTVDMMYDRELLIELFAKRKRYSLQQRAQLTIPRSYDIPPDVTVRGVEATVTHTETAIIIDFT